MAEGWQEVPAQEKQAAKRHGLIVAALLVGLLAGGLVGYLLAGTQPPARSTLPNPPPVATNPDTAEKPSPRQPEGAYAPSLPDQTAHKPNEAVAAQLREAIDKVETIETRRGSGVISGHVRLADGTPLAGVTVKAAIARARDWKEKPVALEDEVAEMIRQRRYERAMERAATSGEDGAYELTGLAETAGYLISGAKPGYRVEYNQRFYREVKPGSTANLVAYAVGIVEVVLKMPDGSLPKYGRLGWTRSRNSSSGGPWAGPVHTLELEPATWTITAEAGQNGADCVSDPVLVEVKLGQPPQHVEIQLKGRVIVNVRIVSAGASPPRVGQVLLQANPPAAPPVREAPGGPPVAATDRSRVDDRLFRFEGLAMGRYRAYTRDVTGAVSAWKDFEVNVTEGAIDVELEVNPPTPDKFIVVRAYGPSGEVLSDCKVFVAIKIGGFTSTQEPTPEIKPDGAVWVPRRVPDKDALEQHGDDWNYEVTVAHKLYSSRTVAYRRTDTHEIEVRLAASSFLSLTMQGFEDHPDKKKLVWQVVKRGSDFDHDAYRRSTGVAQRGRFGPLDPGEYDILLTYARDVFDSVELVRQPVALAPGENSATAAVPLFNSLTITLPAGATPEPLRLKLKTNVRGNGTFLPAFKDGRVTISPVATGEYALIGRNGEITVRVPEQTEVVFDPAPYNALRLKLRVGGQVEALGLKDGDILVTVAGQDVADLKEAYARITQETAKSSTTWQVMRAGVQTDVTFDGRELARIIGETGDNEFKAQPAYR